MSGMETPLQAVTGRKSLLPALGWRTLIIRPETAILLLMVLAATLASRLSPYFADIAFILESSTYYIEFCLVALVLTLIIIAGEIDLSIASMMALSACVFAIAVHAGTSIPLALAASLGSGLVMGALNGLLVTIFRLPSIVVTIGTLTLYRGLAQVLVGDHSIGSFPAWFVGLDLRTIGSVPLPVAIFVVTALLLGLGLGSTIYGRQIYQIGTNEIAARHVGIRVDRIKMGLFLGSGIASAFAGLMMASRLGSVRYDLAAGGELQIVLIAILGGTSIFGGRGTILGTFLASWLLVIIATGMTVANVTINAQLTVLGVLLIVSTIATNIFYVRGHH
ncbi:MAG: ABC transporter permease [Terriglobales bacterium]